MTKHATTGGAVAISKRATGHAPEFQYHEHHKLTIEQRNAIAATVAETMMGWKEALFFKCDHCHNSGVRPPDSKLHARGKSGCVHGGSYPIFTRPGGSLEGVLVFMAKGPGKFFKPFADAGDDYLVLECFRSRMNPEQIAAFSETLATMWDARAFPGKAAESLALRKELFRTAHFYRPGDYVVAASAVLSAKKKGN